MPMLEGLRSWFGGKGIRCYTFFHLNIIYISASMAS